MRSNLERYFAATRSRPLRVADCRLESFTCGHHEMLGRLESRLLAGDMLPEPGDVALALAVLERPGGDCAPAPRRVRRIGRRLVRLDAAVRQVQIDGLLGWLADQFAFPKFWSKPPEPGASSMGSPWWLRMKVALRLPAAEFAALPLPEALHQWFTLLELEGCMQLRTDEENRMIEAAVADG